MSVISFREVRLIAPVSAVIFSFLCILCLFISDFVVQGLCKHHSYSRTGPALGISKASTCGVAYFWVQHFSHQTFFNPLPVFYCSNYKFSSFYFYKFWAVRKRDWCKVQTSINKPLTWSRGRTCLSGVAENIEPGLFKYKGNAMWLHLMWVIRCWTLLIIQDLFFP